MLGGAGARAIGTWVGEKAAAGIQVAGTQAGAREAGGLGRKAASKEAGSWGPRTAGRRGDGARGEVGTRELAAVVAMERIKAGPKVPPAKEGHTDARLHLTVIPGFGFRGFNSTSRLKNPKTLCCRLFFSNPSFLGSLQRSRCCEVLMYFNAPGCSSHPRHFTEGLLANELTM